MDEMPEQLQGYVAFYRLHCAGLTHDPSMDWGNKCHKY